MSRGRKYRATKVHKGPASYGMLNEGSSFISVWNKEQEEAEQDNPSSSANTRTQRLAPEKNRGKNAAQQSESTWHDIWQVCEKLPTTIEIFTHFLLATLSMEEIHITLLEFRAMKRAPPNTDTVVAYGGRVLKH